MVYRPHSTLLPQYFAALYALMIVYASLRPFAGWMAPIPGTPYFLLASWPPRFTRFDIGINLIAYAPLGFFVALIGSKRTGVKRIGASLAAGALLSLAMETAQMFLPMRDASAMDFLSNMAGAALGAVLTIVFHLIPGLRKRVGAWRQRVFLQGRSGDFGLALLGTWLLAQVNPGIPLFAATFDPSLELTSDFAGTLLQAAQSSFNVVGVGLFLALLLRQRHFLGGAVLLLIGSALMLKGIAAILLLRQTVVETWIKPGVLFGTGVGVAVLLVAIRLPRPARTTLCAVALLSSLVAPLLAPDMWQARAPLALFDWPYGQLLNFNGLTHAVLVVWPVLASVFLLWQAGQPGWGHTVQDSDNPRV
ncbi:MAG: VanZ family protein [Casimicrobiaceae bacterium]